MAKNKIENLHISSIRLDSGAQFRAEGITQSHVAELRGALERGDKLPPVIVFFDGKDRWLGGGFHRVEAHLHAGRENIRAEVRIGTKEDAQAYGAGDNQDPLLPRSNDTKRAQVEWLLQNRPQMGVSGISRHVGISRPTIYRILDASPHLYQALQANGIEYVDKHGNISKMKIANIGKNKTSPVKGVTGENGSVNYRNMTDEERQAREESVGEHTHRFAARVWRDEAISKKCMDLRAPQTFLIEANRHFMFVDSFVTLGVKEAEAWHIKYIEAVEQSGTAHEFLLRMWSEGERMDDLQDELRYSRLVHMGGLLFSVLPSTLNWADVPQDMIDWEHWRWKVDEIAPDRSEAHLVEYFKWLEEEALRAEAMGVAKYGEFVEAYWKDKEHD